MSRLADRAKSYPLASFGAALLPPELGGPLPAQFVQRVDRYVTRLPATSRFAVRAGLASLAAAATSPPAGRYRDCTRTSGHGCCTGSPH